MTAADPLLTSQPHWLIRHPLVFPFALLSAASSAVWKLIIAHGAAGELREFHITIFSMIIVGIVVTVLAIYLILGKVAWRLVEAAHLGDVRDLIKDMKEVKRDVGIIKTLPTIGRELEDRERGS